MSPRLTSLKPALLLACLCVLLVAGRAWALNTDKNQPVYIDSDYADFQGDPKNPSIRTGIYSGHVVITQGSIELRGDKAILHIVNNDLSIADVTGNPVTFVQHPEVGEPMRGEAQELTYDAAKDEITLITNAKLTQEVLQNPGKGAADSTSERLMTADVIHYNTDTQRVMAKAGDEQQRVHVSFPPKTAAPAAGTARAATPATGRKSPTVPATGSHVPMTLGAPPQSTAPAPASTSAPAASTQPGQAP